MMGTVTVQLGDVASWGQMKYPHLEMDIKKNCQQKDRCTYPQKQSTICIIITREHWDIAKGQTKFT